MPRALKLYNSPPLENVQAHYGSTCVHELAQIEQINYFMGLI